MFIRTSLLLSTLLLFLLPATSYSQGGFSHKDYCLVWSDEFNYNGLPDSDNWSYETGYVRNNEDQYYTQGRSENARVENGHLIIEAREDNWTGPDGETHQYTSASIHSRGKVTHQYGRFEIRAKIDTREGSWPAFWTLGQNGEWPSNGEIDIMEYYQNAIHANVAWGTDTRWEGEWDSESRNLSNFPDGWEDEFHTWAMEWTEDTIRLYVDGVLLNSTDLDNTINGSISDIENPFHQGHYILLNQAIGGNNGGDPSNTDFPIQYIIDYVRVYQKGNCNLDCNWEENGNAYLDQCGRCIEGNTGKQPCSPDCNGNILDNPGFETGDLSSWEGWGTRSATTSETYSGNYGIEVGEGAAEMVVDVEPNTRYVLNGQAKKSGGGWVRLGVKEHGALETYTQASNTTWEQVEHTFTTGDATTARIYFYNGSGGTAYGDDFNLKPAGCGDDSCAATSSTITPTACGNYTVPSGGESYTTSGTYYDTILNAAGCDSIITINLTMHSPCDSDCNGNMLGNPGYETGDLSSWEGWGTRSVTASDVYSGNYSVEVGDGAAEKVVNVEPNTEYILQGYGRSSDGSWVRLGVKEHDAQESYAEVSGTQWTQMEHTFTTGDTNSARIYFYNGSGGTAYGDNFSLKPVCNEDSCSSTSSTITPTVCGNYTVPSGNGTYATSGIYYDTIPNAAGCDSIITINLTINNNSSSDVQRSVCGSYTVPSGDETYNTSGVYNDTIPNTKGCDSVITIDLTVNNTSYAEINRTVCDSFTVPSGEETYATSGTYMDTIPNHAGCDSIITINLSMGNTSSTIEPAVCDSYTVPSGDETYTTSGTYYDTVPNEAGCNNIITIHLTVNNTTSFLEPTVCGNYTVPSGDETYTTSGTYYDTIPNATGCDSIMQINLTVTNIDTAVAQRGDSLTAEMTGASYQWLDCDANYNVISGENNRVFYPSSSGTYAVEISANGCTDTSACTSFIVTGIEQSNFEKALSVYPNPTRGHVTIDLKKVFRQVNVTVRTNSGKLVSGKQHSNTDQLNADIKGASGYYILTIETGSGKTAVVKVLKE